MTSLSRGALNSVGGCHGFGQLWVRWLVGLCSTLIPAVMGCSAAFVSTDVDKELGVEAAEAVERHIGIYGADTTADYVRSVGQRLVSHHDDDRFEFTFQIIDQMPPNAFAIPGGGIYVSRGLLLLANSEDELAGVLGHEIIHVTERHSVKVAQKGILPGILSIPGKVIGLVSADLGSLINSPFESLGDAYLAKHSRHQEKEADAKGMQLAAQSGYDPGRLAVMLEQLEKDAEMLSGDVREFSFFDTHPMTPDRVSAINAQAAKIAWQALPPVAADRADFLRRLEGLDVGANPAQGVFRDQQFMQPVLNFTVTFPSEWVTTNTPLAVAAQAPAGEAMVALGLSDARDPVAAGEAFVTEIETEYQITPTDAGPRRVGRWPGYLVTLTDTTSEEPVYLHYVWLLMESVVYKLIAVGPERYRDTLLDTAVSLRPMSEAERRSIKSVRLRVAVAREGESVEALGVRTGNMWNASYTAMVNDIPESRPLANGQLIKVAIQEPFVP